MRTEPRWRAIPALALTVLCTGALVGASPAPEASALPPQVVHPGDSVVEMERPLALDLTAAGRGSLARNLAQAAWSVSSTVPPTGTPPPPVVDVHYTDPAVGERIYRAAAAPLLISVPAGPPRTASYWVALHDSLGAYDMRIPAAPRTFSISIVPRWANAVLTGTGNQERVVFGETVPIYVELAHPEEVEAATVAYRSADASAYTTMAMTRGTADGQPERWNVEVPRPPGLDSRLDYYVTIQGPRGGLTRYGTPDRPHHVHLLDPTVKRDERDR